MIIYHGTKSPNKLNIEGVYEAKGKKGSFENGPGLYTVNDYFLALNFGKVIAIEIELKKEFDIKNVHLDVKDIRYFLATISSTQTKKFLNNFDMDKYQKRSYAIEGKIRADNFLTYMLIENEGKEHLFAQKLNDFFVENNIKYAVGEFSGKKMVNIYDFSVIKRKVEDKDIKDSDLEFKYNKEKPEVKKESSKKIKI